MILEIKNRLGNLLKKMIDSSYGAITLLEIMLFLLMFFVIMNSSAVNYVFEKEDIILSTEGEERKNNVIENIDDGTHFFLTPSISLEEGIYQITINYEADGDNNNCDILSTSNGAYSRYSDYVTLPAYSTERQYDIWANDRLDTMQVKIGYANAGRLEVKRVEIATAWNSNLYRVFKLLVILVLINIICYLWFRREKIKTDKVVLIGIFGITLLSSVGLLGEYYQWGHDLDFHMLRIEGLKDGLLSGAFPVRIQPNWVNGWGYPVSIMYGDISLIFPALLRIVGVPVQSAYKSFVILVNLGTAISAYYCFKKISNSKYVGLMVSLLYTLSIYRMCCVYVRAAVGEYTAMMFLPMIVLCFYYALVEDVDSDEYGKKLWIPVLGFSGLIQTHILTCQMAAIFIVLLCLICYKRVFVKKTFLYLSKVAGISLLINLWFIVPLVQYMGEELNVMVVELDGRIQRIGITLMELLAPIYNGNAFGTHWNEIVSISEKFPISLGSAFLIILAIFLVLCGNWKTCSIKKASSITFWLAVLSIFMATNLFPYNAIFSYSKAIGKLIAKGKLPYRYLSISGILCALLACLVFVELKNRWKKEYVRGAAVVLCLIAAFQGTSYVYQVLLHNSASVKYDEIALNTGNLMGDEYLYLGSNTWTPFQDNVPHGNGAEINSYQKEYSTVLISGKAIEENASITVPLFYYVGYEAKDVETKETLELTRSQDNNRICVNLPIGYDGTFQVKFTGRFVWHVAGVISLLSFLAFLFFQIKREMFEKAILGALHVLRKIKVKVFDLLKEYNLKKQKKKNREIEKTKEDNRYIGKILFNPVLWNIIVTSFVFGIILVLNFHTEFASDDFKYHFFFDTMGGPTNATHRINILEIIPSMMNHRQMCNGRIVSHGLLQLALMLGKTGFKILNSLMYILLGTLIYKHASYGRKQSVSLLVLIYVCMWFFLPQFGKTVLWASGAANYLWNGVIILGFLLLYRVHLSDQGKINNTKKNTVIICAFGFLAGCTNENTGGAAVLLVIMFIAIYFAQKILIPKWVYSGLVGSIIGVIFLVAAPASRRVSSQTNIQGLWNRFLEIMTISKKELSYLMVVLCFVALLNIAFGRQEKRGRVLPLMYFFAGVASICVLCFSAIYPERAWFVGVVLFIVVVGYLYNGILLWPKPVYCVLTGVMIFVFAVSFKVEFQVINHTYEQVKEGVDIIEEKLEKGETEATIPMIPYSGNKYDPFNDTGYVKESADDWLNAWMAEYYGLEAIYGYQKE